MAELLIDERLDDTEAEALAERVETAEEGEKVDDDFEAIVAGLEQRNGFDGLEIQRKPRGYSDDGHTED